MGIFNFAGKHVMVAGGTGLIGIPLVYLLLEKGALVRVVSLDDSSRAHPKAEFRRLDLLEFRNCLRACKGIDYVFNLLCAKGSPKIVHEKPATLFDHNLLPDLNLLRAAQKTGVKGFLIASSLGVYGPAEVFYEDSVWSTFPSENDWFAGWAKRMEELQAEAYAREFNWNDIVIVRPANTYGPYDDFDSEGAMVVPSLIKRAMSGENPLRIWGDGSQVRDFMFAREVARGMIHMAEQNPRKPVNLGSGMRVTIKELALTIAKNMTPVPVIQWDVSKPTGDRVRVLDTARARSLGFIPRVSLAEGIRETMEWYRIHGADQESQRFNIFSRPQ